MPANKDYKTPHEQHRKKIGQFNSKQNEVLNKKIRAAALQRKQKPFFTKHKQDILFVLYVLIFSLLAGAAYYYFTFIKKTEENDDLFF